MTVRRAGEADRETLRELYRELVAERPPPAYLGDVVEEELAEVDEILRSGIAVLAEADEHALGFALARIKRRAVGYVSDLYVRQDARRRGVAQALMREVVAALREQGVNRVTLNVDVDNAEARAVYARWGFEEESLDLGAELDALEARVGERERRASFGSLHVQTDDLDGVVQAVRRYVPRLRGSSRGSVVTAPRNGWTAVYDELCDREPAILRRFARELSDRMGAVVLLLGVEEGALVRFVLFERGRVMDEYASLPEYHAPLPPGEVVALAANPTVVARLTGADPARLRAAARTGKRPDELPPASELLARIAEVLGIEGGGHGYEEARGIPGAVELPR